MWWLLFAASAVCLIRWAWTGAYRRWPCAALFVIAYLCNLYRPRHMPHWHAPWLAATAVLLPLRIAMLAEVTRKILAHMQERWIVVGALTSSCGVVVGILLYYMPINADFYSVVMLRQYLQIAMMAWVGFLLLYARIRDGKIGYWHAVIVGVLLADYAVAATFEEHSGLSDGFIFSTPALRASVKMFSALILAFCLLAWTAAAESCPPEEPGKPPDNQNRQSAAASH